jgi:hypothetical protein
MPYLFSTSHIHECARKIVKMTKASYTFSISPICRKFTAIKNKINDLLAQLARARAHCQVSQGSNPCSGRQCVECDP